MRARQMAWLDSTAHHLDLALGGWPEASPAKRLMPPVSGATLLRLCAAVLGTREVRFGWLA